MTLAEIHQAIPHRPPMLLLDEIVTRDEGRIHCRKRFRAEEFFFQGHYPSHPLVPGVILCEAGMQAGAVLLSALIDDTGGKVPVATRLNEVKLKRMIRPGEVVDIEVDLIEQLSTAYFLRAKVTCAGKLAARFEFACTMTEA